ncbi:MAG: DUF4293 domain-containing protein [Planctomycetes bacterium]|nr:DUF4293 domain-containing protein [Planctomycetota bacterium]
MDSKETEKTPIAVSKSFMAVGPTLHYSHKNVQRCWLLAVVAFGITCFFFSKIATGSFWSFDIQTATRPAFWHLGQTVVSGVSIFEYPWQIVILGLLMGIMSIVPVLISQLMSFGYSSILILAVFFLANLPGFAICLLISCIAVACRPLRFRSRFVAISLCTAPQLLYWGYFGAVRGVEPIKWGFSFAPWIFAWIDALTIAGFVLGIGHFTRYRPGLVWIFTTITLVLAIAVFEVTIGFDELDYQLYVAKNNPEQVSEFHDQSITETLDRTTKDPLIKKYLEGFFYPADPIALRAELKKEIQIKLSYDSWPSWLTVPPELEYQTKRQWLFAQYDLFINKRSNSNRMPIALYCKALLSEYGPDINVLGQKEVLHFYSDYPYERSRELWYRLYSEFSNSPESIEARWRIAKHWAGQGKFEQADKILVQAETMLTAERSKLLEKEQPSEGAIFGLFHLPADSVMTLPKLDELKRRIDQLRLLIGPENRTDQEGVIGCLSEFVMLNSYASDYSQRLDRLLEQMEDKDRLRDNILLAQAKILLDEQLREEKLSQLHKEFSKTDGGMLALYELGLLKIGLYQSEQGSQQKKKYLADARANLESFIKLYPASFCAEQVKKNLDGLPSN